MRRQASLSKCRVSGLHPADRLARSYGAAAPGAAINEEPSEGVPLRYSDELTPDASVPRPRGGARHERRLCFGVQGSNRVQRAALLPSGCFSLYASYFPVE